MQIGPIGDRIASDHILWNVIYQTNKFAGFSYMKFVIKNINLFTKKKWKWERFQYISLEVLEVLEHFKGRALLFNWLDKSVSAFHLCSQFVVVELTNFMHSTL